MSKEDLLGKGAKALDYRQVDLEKLEADVMEVPKLIVRIAWSPKKNPFHRLQSIRWLSGQPDPGTDRISALCIYPEIHKDRYLYIRHRK